MSVMEKLKAIEQYAQKPYLMKKHGMAGRKRLERYYSWENNARVLQGIYEKRFPLLQFHIIHRKL